MSTGRRSRSKIKLQSPESFAVLHMDYSYLHQTSDGRSSKTSGPIVGAATLVVADAAESGVIYVKTSNGDDCTNGFTIESGSGLAGFTDTEAVGVWKTSRGDTDDIGNVGAAEENLGACFDVSSCNVETTSVSVGDISDSAIAVDAIACCGELETLSYGKE